MSEQKQNRAWKFTINNPEKEEDLHDVLKDCRYAIWQLEKGAECGTLHYEGYVLFKNPVRFAAVKKLLPRAHLEPRKGTHEQAKKYCSKEETRVEGPWEIGEEPQQGRRTDLEGLKQMVNEGATMEQIADEHFGSFLRYEKGIMSYKKLKTPDRNSKTLVTVIWGETNVGKTQCILEKYPNAYWLTRPRDKDNVWFDGYDGHEEVVIDEFYGWIPFDLLLRIMDASPLQVPIKGGFQKFVAKRILITSNHSPTVWYKNIVGTHILAFERRLDMVIKKLSYESYIVERMEGEWRFDDKVIEGPINFI